MRMGHMSPFLCANTVPFLSYHLQPKPHITTNSLLEAPSVAFSTH